MPKKRLQIKGQMKRMPAMLILIGLLMGFGLVLEKDTLSKGRMNIKAPTGEIKSYLQPDTLQSDRINIYDKYGNLTGFWVRDTLRPDTWVFKHTLSN